MKVSFKFLIISIILAIILPMALIALNSQSMNIDVTAEKTCPPRIDPDYTGVTIPPNIAPLNFKIGETGAEYLVLISSKNKNQSIRIKSHAPQISIPFKKWKTLLSENRGEKLIIEIAVKGTADKWTQFQPIENTISQEEIDSHVVYRLINPGYVLWWDMGIYQRNLENFDESPIFTNRMTNHNCMNCHSFCQNNPDKMLFHMRAAHGGTMLIQNGDVKKLNTATDYTMSAGVYPSWHPDGKHIAFSVNKIQQNFHAHQDRTIYVWDSASDIVIYNIETNTITTSPKVSTHRLENLPNWSPDGKYIYFCSAPDSAKEPDYANFKYDLRRISYDVTTGEWGDVEILLSEKDTGRSVSFPKVSPDGKYLLFCMSDYGYFSIHFKSSDLYMMDLATKAYWKLDINSEQSESYHSWSSNSKWFVFASKQRDGLCSRFYFSSVDDSGKASKPVLMPQENPEFYDTFIMNYNIPELITGPVKTSHWDLMNVARGEAISANFDKTVDIDALSGATKMVEK